MCGIICIFSTSNHNTCSDLLNTRKIFEANISNRGPNVSNTHTHSTTDFNLIFSASVLWLQGANITPQPIVNHQSIFIYNGDVFGGQISNELRNEFGDTKLFLSRLENANVITALENVQGPYAFVYLDLNQNKLYFGRDIYGRRSLLIGKAANQIVLTSVAKKGTAFDFMEVPSIGIFMLDLNNKSWAINPWRHRNRNFQNKLNEMCQFIGQNIVLNDVEYFSPRDFIKPDLTHLQLLEKARHSSPDVIFNLLLHNKHWLDDVIKLQQIMLDAVKTRISTQPKFCQNCFNQPECDHALTGVLFSGGIDCSIVALLSDKFTDAERPIDLINVAFDRVKDYKTPDRVTALETLQELRCLCPNRQWNFVEVNVTEAELDLVRSEHIADLIYPLNTILDDSLGCALWFASRAKANTYTSPCRILLVGMGADELFGGYTRHRGALKHDGWAGLHTVLDEDWQNLSHRNLGRDDRVVSDHGRQLRTPYLDEHVVEFVRSLNCWEKSWPLENIPQGVGEKILLRCLGYHLGLKKAATLRKRALQFGSRIANPKENAYEVSGRL